MSLDITLTGASRQVPCVCSCCRHEHERTETTEFFDTNITHNLNKMADAAGIYYHCWRPDEIGITKAGQLIEPLTKAVADLRGDPERFKEYNPPNGWGSYESFLPWVEEYLEACIQYPEADIHVSR